ncbi:MAG TPA: class I SAM-dependent methyltransferase [Solirubrobacterales bacterium]
MRFEANQQVFDSVADQYDDLALKPAEQAVLRRLAPRLPELEMLDIGVGAGRTGYTYAPLVRRYVGIDYAPRMLARAQALLGDEPNVTLLLADARDLSGVRGPFDFVLFSFNGIDTVGHEDRLRILAEVRGVLKPEGLFQFSTHSLGALPLDDAIAHPARRMSSLAYRVYTRVDDIRRRRRIHRVNASLSLEEARRRGWTIVKGRGHDFRLDDYYVDPSYQVRQLTEAGLETVAVYDCRGKPVQLPHRGRDAWLDYLCRPA